MMKGILSYQKRPGLFSVLELLIIVGLACVPLFISFPFRVNIFLSWEGAYRMSQGEIPYRDFGMPLGYMYWVIPAIFFKIFGTQMITLVKAQVFINILSGLAFRSVLKSIGVQPGIRFLSVFLYCISFSFFNFWPWYNHTVIVYEMIGLAFLMKYIFAVERKWILLSLSALFVFFSFFTKQDGGGLALFLCTAILLYNCFAEKNWKPILIYAVSFAIAAFAIIAPLTKFNFGYWFNHGQPPHTSRFSAFEIVDEFLISSQWIKFYCFIILLLAIASFKNLKEFFSDKRSAIFLLLTLGILAEAAVLQVTSYTPPDNNIFFHSFAFAFIVSYLANFLKLDFTRLKPLFVALFGLILWWSGIFWKYIQKVGERFLPTQEAKANTGGENIVNKRTYMLNIDTTDIPASQWTFTGLKSFDNIYMPKPTVDGLHRLMNMDLVKNNKNLHVLNMSELTPLAVEMPYQLEKGPGIPLWYHLGVAMFNREAKMYEQWIAQKKYDLVLFEHIPVLNNFYPFRVRDSLLQHYQLIDSFPAPRHSDTKGLIEVFVK
jgi:hypothetical protein